MKEKLQSDKGGVKWLLIAAALVGLALIILPELIFKGEDKEEKSAEYSASFYTEELEERIKRLILELDGVERAAVLITLENTGEQVYAKNTSSGTGTSASDYVIIKGSREEEPVKLTEIYPAVRGVAVVCTGGTEATVQRKVTEMLSAALGIATNRITVTG